MAQCEPGPGPVFRRSFPLVWKYAFWCRKRAYTFTLKDDIDLRCIPHFPGIWGAFRSTLGEAGLELRVSLWRGTNVDPGQCCLWRTSFHRLCWPDHGDRGTPSWPGNLALGRRIRHWRNSRRPLLPLLRIVIHFLKGVLFIHALYLLSLLLFI